MDVRVDLYLIIKMKWKRAASSSHSRVERMCVFISFTFYVYIHTRSVEKRIKPLISNETYFLYIFLNA